MSEQELPPWLREQLSRLQQLQQNLQAVMMQKQQVELEIVETDRALEELRKIEGDNAVYKGAGPLLIKTNKDDVLKELEERKELSNTRITVLGKQETRIKDNLKEVENKINQMIRGMQATGGGGVGFGTPAGGQGGGAPGAGGFGTRPQGQ
ncbi:MAG: prefoldin subunit beta [Nitrososphaeraceae archaeon]|jgi:prefoldin beta subunit|nr:prefoldin subunit beta [Nitrososphaeraceae archaeon]MDW0314788.1 prefoldin subunit beta [Nitrososphaeraceae archaeon]MDW0331671.1 prefoldin subunit beta [Nitrososphaeraceae archaeon]